MGSWSIFAVRHNGNHAEPVKIEDAANYHQKDIGLTWIFDVLQF